MKLTDTDLNYTVTRMKVYDIKYQEIFNELLDHVLTAIEERRAAGDNREINTVFQVVVDEHFGGYMGIENVAKAHEKAYKSKVAKMMQANYRHYFNWKFFMGIVFAIIIGYNLPDAMLVRKLLVVLLAALSLFPMMYSFYKLRSIRPGKGKTSLAYSYIISQANLPSGLFNCIVFLPQVFSDDEHFSIFNKLNPTFSIAYMAFLIIFALSTVRLCNQEIKSVLKIS